MPITQKSVRPEPRTITDAPLQIVRFDFRGITLTAGGAVQRETALGCNFIEVVDAGIDFLAGGSGTWNCWLGGVFGSSPDTIAPESTTKGAYIDRIGTTNLDPSAGGRYTLEKKDKVLARVASPPNVATELGNGIVVLGLRIACATNGTITASGWIRYRLFRSAAGESMFGDSPQV